MATETARTVATDHGFLVVDLAFTPFWKKKSKGHSYLSDLFSSLFVRVFENSRINFHDPQLFFRCSVIVLHLGRRFNDSICFPCFLLSLADG